MLSLATLHQLDMELPRPRKPKQKAYTEAKIYTALRHRLQDAGLPASCNGVLLAYHALCDADTGRFNRDDVTVRVMTGMPKSTVSWAFARLNESEFITHDGKSYLIVGYERDRLHSRSYARLTPAFFEALPRMVRHHNPRAILITLEVYDRDRVPNSDRPKYGMKTLIEKRHLGTCPSRVYQTLQLLPSDVRYTIADNASKTDVNLEFFVIADPTVSKEDEAKKHHQRRLHGLVSAETKRSYAFAQGKGELSWRELAFSTRKLIQAAVDYGLRHEELLRVAGLFGAYCARNDVKHMVPYLSKALDDLIGYIRPRAA